MFIESTVHLPVSLAMLQGVFHAPDPYTELPRILMRYLHIVGGITWIGLLYFFNFVQVPAYAQMEASARNNAIDKLTSRALWWFRWAAAATLVSGIALLFIDPKELYKSDFMKSAPGVAIYAGILLAVVNDHDIVFSDDVLYRARRGAA